MCGLNELDIARCSPKWVREVPEIVKGILWFQIDFHSGLKVWGAFGPGLPVRAWIWVPLAVSTPRRHPDCLSLYQQMLLQDRVVNWHSPLHSPCLHSSAAFSLSRPAPDHLACFSSPVAKVLNGGAKNISLKAPALFLRLCSSVLSFKEIFSEAPTLS